MAVKYWSLKEFIKNISKGVYYIIRYQNTLYYLDEWKFVNLSTLEVLENRYINYLLSDIKKFKFSKDKFFEEVFDQCEIITSGRWGGNSYKEFLNASKSYMNRLNVKSTTNPYIVYESIYNKYCIETRKGYIAEYVPYEDFLEKYAYSHLVRKKFKIKHNDKIYLLKGGTFYCTFGEIYPTKCLNKFKSYDEIFLLGKISTKSIAQIWDSVEIVFLPIPSTVRMSWEDYNGGAHLQIEQAKENYEELVRLYEIAENNMIKEGHIPLSCMDNKRAFKMYWQEKLGIKRKDKSKS